jgi:hypothetical protein
MSYTLDAQGNIIQVSGLVPHNVIEKKFTLAQDLGNARAGTTIMLAVTPSDTSQSVELENYMGGYKQHGLGQDLLSPLVPVQKETFKRRDFSHMNTFAPEEDRVGRDGKINEIEAASTVIEDKTEEHALAAFVSYAAENDAVATYNVRATHLRMIQEKLSLSREIRRFNTATTTGTWAAANYTAITTNYRWNTGSTKIPLANVRALCKTSWAPIDAILMNIEVSGWFLADAGVVAQAQLVLGVGPKPGLLVESMTPGVQQFTLPGLPPFYVLDSKKYVSGAMTTVLADDVVGVCSPSVLAGGETLSSFLSFRYRGRSGTGYTVNEYVPFGRGLNGGTMLEAGYADCDCTPGADTAGDGTSHVGFLVKSVLTGS